MNAVPSAAGDEPESDRIDELLSSALADQARERRMLVETVFGAKSALVKAEEELSALREMLEKRDDALMEAVRRNNETLAETISARVKPPKDAGMLLRMEAIEEAILQLAAKIAELPGLLRHDVEVSAVAISERVGEEAASLLADLREDQVEVVHTLASMSEKEVADLKDNLELARQEVVERVAMSAGEIVQNTHTTAEQLVEHLTGYLVQRDDHMAGLRDQRLVELFMKLGDSIGRSNRRKLGKALGQEVGPAPASRPAAPPPPPPSLPPPPPPSVPRSFRQPEPGPADEPFRSAARPDQWPFDRQELPAEVAPEEPLEDPADSMAPFADEDLVELTQAMPAQGGRVEDIRSFLVDAPDEFPEDLADEFPDDEYADEDPPRARRGRRRSRQDQPRSAAPSRQPPESPDDSRVHWP